MGSLFAPYEYFYTWRKVTGDETIEQLVSDSVRFVNPNPNPNPAAGAGEEEGEEEGPGLHAA